MPFCDPHCAFLWFIPLFRYYPTEDPCFQDRQSHFPPPKVYFMNRHLLVIGFFVCAILSIYCSFSAGAFMQAQTRAPYPPFTAEQARLGKELALKSLEIRRQITNAAGPAEPFKISRVRGLRLGGHAEPAFGNDHRTPGKSESRSQAVCES